jgi:HEAT repeat protein
MPHARPFDFEQIKRDIRSPDQPTRGTSMAALYHHAQQNSAIHQEALELFRASVMAWPDYMTASNAARGIELIAGPVEGRKIWLALLNQSKAELAGAIAQSLKDVSFVPVLLELIDRRPEWSIQLAAVRTLGRMKDRAAFDAIRKRLADRGLRPHAVEALGELGDPRAIADLEPLLTDRTEAWEIDNHGPMLRVCDLAKDAIAQLQKNG